MAELDIASKIRNFDIAIDDLNKLECGNMYIEDWKNLIEHAKSGFKININFTKQDDIHKSLIDNHLLNDLLEMINEPLITKDISKICIDYLTLEDLIISGSSQNKNEFSSIISKYIALSGNLDLMKLLVDTYKFKSSCWDDRILFYAGISGNLNLMKWIRKNNINKKVLCWRKHVIFYAALSGNYDMVVWMCCNGCNLENKKILGYAIIGGNCELVRWLYNRYIKSDELTLPFGILSGNLSMVKLICDYHYCSSRFTPLFVKISENNEIKNYLISLLFK